MHLTRVNELACSKQNHDKKNNKLYVKAKERKNTIPKVNRLKFNRTLETAYTAPFFHFHLLIEKNSNSKDRLEKSLRISTNSFQYFI